MRTPHRRKGSFPARYTPLAAALACLLAPHAMAAVFTVSNTNDSGAGSLRQATIDAGFGCVSGDTIKFAIPGSGPFVISLATPLTLNCPATIDGYTQPGATPNASTTGFDATGLVEIDGRTLAPGACALEATSFYGGAVTVQGLSFRNAPVGLCNGTAMIARGNQFVGNATGIRPNSGATIGGAGVQERNLISSSAGSGIAAGFTASMNITNNVITLNAIGIRLDCTDSVAMADNLVTNNSGDGIFLVSGDCTSTTGNKMTRNLAYANGGKNINLDFIGGPRPNDAGDIDGGQNNGQNSPESVVITQAGGNTSVTFTLDSPGTFDIEAFENDSASAPAGQKYLATFSGFTASGPTTGTFTIPGNHNFISLTATKTSNGDTSEYSAVAALAPTAGVSVSSNFLDFGSVAVGSTSALQSTTLTSTGGAPYQIRAIASDALCSGGPICASGDFSCSTTCVPGTPHAAGASCSITGQFKPTSLGGKFSSIYVCDNTASSPQRIDLGGTGVPPPPLEISPSAFDFGDVLVGSQSPETTFSIINHATVAVDIGPVTISGNFLLKSTNCGASLPPVSACLANVAFAPQQPGLHGGTLEVTIPTTAMPALAAPKATVTSKADLKGNGTQFPVLSLPAAIDLGMFTLGAAAPLSREILLTNAGNAVLTFASVSASAPFTLINNCPLNVQPGASCSLVVEFRSTTSGVFSGVLNVLTNASGGSRAITLTARAQPVPLPVIHVSPVSIGFGNQMIGTTSVSQRTSITNEGGAIATLGTLATDTDFVVTSTTCGIALEPQTTCFANVALRPLGFGQRSGRLLVNSNAQGSPDGVDLVGTGCRPYFIAGNRVGGGNNCSP